VISLPNETFFEGELKSKNEKIKTQKTKINSKKNEIKSIHIGV